MKSRYLTWLLLPVVFLSSCSQPQPAPVAPVTKPTSDFVVPELSSDPGVDLLECFHPDVRKRGNAGHFLSEWRLDRIPTSGVISVGVVLVNFEDVQGEGEVIDRAKLFMDEMARFYQSTSFGRVSFDFRIHPEYVAVPKSSFDYGMQSWGGGDAGAYAQDAIRYADPVFDFSGIDVLFVIPPEDSLIAFGPNMRFDSGKGWKTNEGTIDNVNVAAGEMERIESKTPHWWWAAHELTHSFGLAHPYAGMFGGIWDISQGWGLKTPELLGWHRLILDWIDPQQVRCFEPFEVGDSFTGYLEKLNQTSSNEKLFVVQMGENKVLVIESRHNGGFDQFSELDEGLLVYVVDLSKNERDGQFVRIIKGDKFSEGLLIGTIIPKSSLEYENYLIRNLGQTDDGDYFEISKLADISPEESPSVKD